MQSSSEVAQEILIRHPIRFQTSILKGTDHCQSEKTSFFSVVCQDFLYNVTHLSLIIYAACIIWNKTSNVQTLDKNDFLCLQIVWNPLFSRDGKECVPPQVLSKLYYSAFLFFQNLNWFLFRIWHSILFQIFGNFALWFLI